MNQKLYTLLLQDDNHEKIFPSVPEDDDDDDDDVHHSPINKY